MLVDCRATEHVINDKSKFINFDHNFQPGVHFDKLADESGVNDIALKRGNACFYLQNSKGHICKCILKMLYVFQLLKQNIFSVQVAIKKWCAYKF